MIQFQNYQIFATVLLHASVPLDGYATWPYSEKVEFGKKNSRQQKCMPNYPIGVRSGSALFGFVPQKEY